MMRRRSEGWRRIGGNFSWWIYGTAERLYEMCVAYGKCFDRQYLEAGEGGWQSYIVCYMIDRMEVKAQLDHLLSWWCDGITYKHEPKGELDSDL